MKHKIFLIAFFLLGWLSAPAQTISQLNVETRFGYAIEYNQGNVNNDNTCFTGKYINLQIDGEITKNLTFSYRQRLNKNTNPSFWDSTDWLHVDWTANGLLSLSAGKQVVAIGGYEYDRAPIDLYYCSEFWNNIPCYQLGVSASFNVSDKDLVLLQVCNSPFRTQMGNNSFAYNLAWYGTHGCWETISSLNLLQISKSRWINYIALGNRFSLGKYLRFDIDFMNRAAKNQVFLLKDMSIMSELSWSVKDCQRLFMKYTYDVNHSGNDADCLVCDGTELSLASMGYENSPIKKHRDALRVSAVVGYSFGTNGNVAGTMIDEQFRAEVCIKAKFDILAGIRKITK